jgi:hypothetical protein
MELVGVSRLLQDAPPLIPVPVRVIHGEVSRHSDIKDGHS